MILHVVKKIAEHPGNIQYISFCRYTFSAGTTFSHGINIDIYYIPYVLTVYFPITHSVRYHPIFHTLYFTLHCACVLINVLLTTIIEMVEILYLRWYNIQLNNLVIVKYGVISLADCISTRLQHMKILTLLVK